MLRTGFQSDAARMLSSWRRHFLNLHLLSSYEVLSKFCTGVVKMAKMRSPFACVLPICMCCFNLNCVWSFSTTVHKSANVVTFLSVRLSIVMKPNTSSGSSSSLSSGTSDCWRIAKRRLTTLLTKWETVTLKKWLWVSPWWRCRRDSAGWWCQPSLTCWHGPLRIPVFKRDTRHIRGTGACATQSAYDEHDFTTKPVAGVSWCRWSRCEKWCAPQSPQPLPGCKQNRERLPTNSLICF